VKKIVIILTIFLSLSLSCNSSKASPNKAKQVKNDIAEYVVVKIKGLDTLKKNPTMTLDFIKNSISGNAGCNQYGGTIITKENTIKFERILATKMYCNVYNSVEKNYLKNLALTTRYEIKTNQILFFGDADILLITAELKTN
jgi:heat shock protein HslJ